MCPQIGIEQIGCFQMQRKIGCPHSILHFYSCLMKNNNFPLDEIFIFDDGILWTNSLNVLLKCLHKRRSQILESSFLSGCPVASIENVNATPRRKVTFEGFSHCSRSWNPYCILKKSRGHSRSIGSNTPEIEDRSDWWKEIGNLKRDMLETYQCPRPTEQGAISENGWSINPMRLKK